MSKYKVRRFSIGIRPIGIRFDSKEPIPPRPESEWEKIDRVLRSPEYKREVERIRKQQDLKDMREGLNRIKKESSNKKLIPEKSSLSTGGESLIPVNSGSTNNSRSKSRSGKNLLLALGGTAAVAGTAYGIKKLIDRKKRNSKKSDERSEDKEFSVVEGINTDHDDQVLKLLGTFKSQNGKDYIHMTWRDLIKSDSNLKFLPTMIGNQQKLIDVDFYVPSITRPMITGFLGHFKYTSDKFDWQGQSVLGKIYAEALKDLQGRSYMDISTMKWYLKYALIDLLTLPWNDEYNVYYSLVTKKFYWADEVLEQEGKSLKGGKSLNELLSDIKDFYEDAEGPDEDYWKKVITLSGFNKVNGVRLYSDLDPKSFFNSDKVKIREATKEDIARSKLYDEARLRRLALESESGRTTRGSGYRKLTNKERDEVSKELSSLKESYKANYGEEFTS